MIISLGEILYDVFPDDKRLGGAPFNFAYHTAQLGIPTHFITRVGDDADGSAIKRYLAGCGFTSMDIQTDPNHPTGKVIVALDHQGHPEFEILSDVAYDHLELDASGITSAKKPVQIVYYGTLIQRTQEIFTSVQQYLKTAAPACKRFYDINLRPECYNAEVIFESLKTADILKLNDSELSYLGETLHNSQEADQFVSLLMENFEIETVALTKGENGSALYTTGGIYRQKAQPLGNVVDTVGAGDAYAAVLALGILRTWPPEKILTEAARFAADICRIKGAIPADSTVYERLTHDLS